MPHAICLIGAGRIGRIHAQNLATQTELELRYVVDPHLPSAEDIATQYNANVTDLDAALADPGLHGVVIASATDTHADFTIRAAEAGKAIFCEKPLDLDANRALECGGAVKKAGVPMIVGFNRRYDPNFRAVKKRLTDGAIGSVEMVHITSRDPSPPPADYVRVSGGLFRDMMIHDLDMARWLLGEEPVEIFATASCLVDDAIGREGDVDSALVTLKTASGKLCVISNSRRASYGYDQRIEVHGSTGMVSAGNQHEDTVTLANSEGLTSSPTEHFFLERYALAYESEMRHFAEVLDGRASPETTGDDGIQALRLADAAVSSLSTGKPIRLD